MKSAIGKIIVVVVLLAAIAGVLSMKSRQQQATAPPETRDTRQSAPQAPERAVTEATPTLPDKEIARPVKKPIGPQPAPATVPRPPKPAKNTAPATPPRKAQPAPAKAHTLPRLLELGADKCVPCKMMQPVLDELRREYPGKLQVDFIDVWKEPAAGERYGIRAIPTQIFFDANGKEIFRHVGFYPKDEILAKFKELQISL